MMYPGHEVQVDLKICESVDISRDRDWPSRKTLEMSYSPPIPCDSRGFYLKPTSFDLPDDVFQPGETRASRPSFWPAVSDRLVTFFFGRDARVSPGWKTSSGKSKLQRVGRKCVEADEIGLIWRNINPGTRDPTPCGKIPGSHRAGRHHRANQS
jgi:hypothetical protein